MLRLGPRITLQEHSVTRIWIRSRRSRFGAWRVRLIMCSNAFWQCSTISRRGAPVKAVPQPGGRVAIDITHEHNWSDSDMRRAWRSVSSWAAARTGLGSNLGTRSAEILEREGFVIDDITEIEKVTGERSVYYTPDQADSSTTIVVSNRLSRAILFGTTSRRVRRGALRRNLPRMQGRWQGRDPLTPCISILPGGRR